MQYRFTPPLRNSEDVYEAPVVTIFDVAVEAGFAASDYDDLTLPEFGVVDEDQW